VISRDMRRNTHMQHGELVLETGQSPTALMALNPLLPLREAAARALFVEAAEKAAAGADGLAGAPGILIPPTA